MRGIASDPTSEAEVDGGIKVKISESEEDGLKEADDLPFGTSDH